MPAVVTPSVLTTRRGRLLVAWVTLGGFVAMVLGCQGSNTTTPEMATCKGVGGMGSDPPAAYRTKGKELLGDVDTDGAGDRVTLRADERRPARCRHLLVVEGTADGTAIAPVAPLSWPGTDPQLLLLAEIDGRPGLEPVVTLSPKAVYRPGAVFTLRDRTLSRMRLEGLPVAELIPFYDEFPAGADCGKHLGTIVVTQGRIADEGDRYWDITRSFYRAAGVRFELVRDERFQVEVGPEARRRWPEVRGDPFLSCSPRVG
jgi:hypothetical protein